MEQDDKAPEGMDAEGESESAPRARNRTVLLTPDITGQVRARLAQEPHMRTPQAPVENSSPARRAPQQAPSEFGRPRTPMASAPVHAVPPPAPAAAPVLAPVEPGAVLNDGIIWSKKTPVVGFLVSFDHDELGEVFVLRSGRFIITSQPPPGGSYMLLQDDSVSAMHAIMRVSESGEVLLLDQLSEFGSGVTHFDSSEEINLSGDKCALEHGDRVRIGKRHFVVCILPAAPEA